MPEQEWARRVFREGDEHGILELLTAVYGHWPSVDIDVEPVSHLRWKLASDPSVMQYHCLRVAGERAVGLEIMILQQYKIRDRTARAFLVTDLAVHPDYRGQGIMRDLWVIDKPEYIDAVDLVASISGNRTVKRHHRRQESNLYLADAIEVLECSLPAGAPAADAFEIRSVPVFDDRVDGLWHRASQQFSLAVIRSKNYLNWRYADPRAGRFTIRFAEDRGDLLGYSVLRRSGGRAYIADLLTLPHTDDVVQALVVDALSRFGEQSESAVRCWLPRHHDYLQVFLSCGFRPTRQVQGFSVVPMGNDYLEFLSTEEQAPVHISIGDTDLV